MDWIFCGLLFVSVFIVATVCSSTTVLTISVVLYLWRMVVILLVLNCGVFIVMMVEDFSLFGSDCLVFDLEISMEWDVVVTATCFAFSLYVEFMVLIIVCVKCRFFVGIFFLDFGLVILCMLDGLNSVLYWSTTNMIFSSSFFASVFSLFNIMSV